MKLKQLFSAVALSVGVAAATISGSASAAIDLTQITGAFSAADVVAGVLSIAAVLATVYATLQAVGIALRMIRGRIS